MAYPVTGPFNKGFELHGPIRPSGYSPLNFKTNQTWFRQARPFNFPLSYSSTVMQVVNESRYRTDDPLNGANGYFVLESNVSLGDVLEFQIASEKAYEKLKNKVGEASQWANNVLEARKTFNAAALAINQLVSFTRRVHRFDFIGAANVLRGVVPQGVSRKKAFADNWLAYHFGWEPLLKDIYAGMKALTRDFSPIVVKGGGSSTKTVHSRVYGAGPNDWSDETLRTVTKVRQCCSVKVGNPNATLLNDLGLANPVAVLWEAIPFSFVVDWFSTVGAVVSSATDFLGVAIESPFRSYLIKTDRHLQNHVDLPGSHEAGESATFLGTNAGRTLGLVGPELRFKPFKGFSTARGATAIALLIQLLPKR